MRLTIRIWEAKRAFKTAALVAAAVLLPFGVAGAQGPPADADEIFIIDADGGDDFDTRTVRRGFELFASGDAAFSGMHATGNYQTGISNYGDCNGTLRNCQGNRVYGIPRGGSTAPYFEVDWAYGVPPSQFVKIRAVAPSVSNASGGGWMAAYNATVLGRPKRFSPADLTLGTMFSGQTNTNDGSCLDHTGNVNGRYGTGIQLLPVNDCPITWGSDGWMGAHPIDAEGYKAMFDLNPDAFAWDFWRVPEEYQRTDKPFQGTRLHTYGETSDYSEDVLLNYGSVIPGGTGAPVFQGYPLGLLIHFDAFNFAVPTVNSSYFVQSTIVNNSEQLWGAPIDYDSLYFGFSIGTLFSSQNVSRYALPDMGMVLYHGSNAQGAGGPCDDPSRSPYGTTGCSGNTSSVRGYQPGATALIILKSPLGDLRNKLFTRTASGTPCTVGVDPFCNPTHPLAGDTLTFNRQTFGDYGGANTVTWNTGVRASFGFMAGDEVNTLDGRSICDWNERTQWRTFRSERWPVEKDYYNKYVPPASPAWDYNKDGIPDTLAMQTCGVNGCAVFSSDTLPGGWKNKRGNIGGLQSFGPISLAAGDTTSIIYAHVGGGDSTQFWAQVNAVMELYLTFYLAPEAPPTASIVSTAVTPGVDDEGETADPWVRLFFSDDPETWVDGFLVNVADKIRAGDPAFSALAALNGGNDALADLVLARANDNFERLEIYKSCDGGSSFTGDSDCDGDVAQFADGSSDVFGWEAYSVLDFDANGGDIDNVFSDGNVDGGREYLYVLVAKSRGATFLLNTATGPDSVNFAPVIRNPLSRSTGDANVVSVYVPASKPSGYVASSATFTTMPMATVPFEVDLTDEVTPDSYRAVFGNEILVQRDSTTGDATPVRSMVTVRRRETVDAAGVAADSVIQTESWTFNSPNEFLVAGTGSTGATVPLAGDTVRTPTTYSGLGFVLANATDPIFGSTTLSGGSTTPARLFGRAEYAGFVIDPDNSLSGDHNPNTEAHVRGDEALTALGLLPSDTVVPRNLIVYMVEWSESNSVGTGTGVYEVTWADDAYGVERGFVLNLQNPAATQAEVQASLAARSLPTTGLTDFETAGLLTVDQSDLVPVKVPFTVRNVTFDRDVEVAMERRVSNRIVLGNSTDTISVEVQEDQWIPGDALYFIETVTEDSTTAVGLALDGSGNPLQRTRRAMTFSTAMLACGSVRNSCNPVTQVTPGATGYNPIHAGDVTRFEYYVGLTAADVYGFDVTGPVTGTDITAITDSTLAMIRVVPNPYVIFSSYQTSAANGLILFTNVPSRGTLRIYSVAGQFVQQIDWTPDDLLGDGDLFYDLRSREGIDIASGLYIWVVTAPSNPSDPASTPILARGKFVVIRGDTR